ncbi:hypothetical protein ACWGB8_16420 [Kitasatospora sp. NPDC054939]
MTAPEPDQDGRLATALFDDLLNHPEPPVPALPPSVRERGRRLRRARRVRTALVGAAATAAVALVTANLTGGPGPTTDALTTGGPNATAVTTAGPTGTEDPLTRVWTAVAGAIPKRFSGIAMRGGPSERILVERGSPSPPAGQWAVGVRLNVMGGQPLDPGQAPTSPCGPARSRPATQCVQRVLSDGSTGWFAAFDGPDPRLEAIFASPEGTVFGLSALLVPDGPTLSLAELESIVSHPSVAAALLGRSESIPGRGAATGWPSGSPLSPGSTPPASNGPSSP